MDVYGKMKTFKNKRVFISGGNGVIGNCLVKMLHADGATILVGDLKPRPRDWPSEIRYRQGDLNYISKNELKDFEPQYYFHLAATFERSAESYEFWYDNFHHNIRLSNYLMSCLKDCPTLEKVIFASSYLIYNPTLYQFNHSREKPYSLKETDEIYPRNLTGVAKLLHEIELRFLNEFKRKNYKIVSARIFRGHGLNSKDVISRWVRSLIKNETLSVYRKEGMFDYIFSEDSAEGLLRLALTEEAEGIVNLGTGKSRKVEDVLAILARHFPKMHYSEIEVDTNVFYEASQADITLFKQLTNWSPKHSLEESISKIVEFEHKRLDIDPHQSEEEFNVLVTSISGKIPLLKSVRTAMDKSAVNGKLYGGDVDDNCIGKYFVDFFWKMPSLNVECINDLKSFCKENKIRSIIPTRDGELMFWSKVKEDFLAEGISIMVSSSEAICTTIDKLQFAQFGERLGFPTIASSLELNETNSSSFVVKERFGAGSKSIGINLSRREALVHAGTLTDPIFQTFIKGREYSVDLYIQSSKKVKGAICRTRNKIVNGESQITVTENNTELAEICSQFAEALKLYGHVIFQVLKDEAGDFY